MLRYVATIVAAVLFAICSQKALAVPDSPDQPFVDIDQFFVRKYSALASKNEKKTRPVIVINGFQYNLLKEDGTTDTFNGTISRSAELKGVAHLGPCLFAIASSHWNNPKDPGWQKELDDLRVLLRQALVSVEKLDWSDDAWPGGETKLRDYVRSSLNKVDATAEKWLSAGDVTSEDYSTFASQYTPNMVALFYLETLGGTYKSLKILNGWKEQVGAENWKKLYVVVAGSQGRSSAGLTPETNPGALVAASTMEPAQVKTHIVMVPGATTIEEALAPLGNAVTAPVLADTTFTSPESQKTYSFYAALKTSDIPLALSNVQSVLKSLKDGTAKDPVLGIGPGEKNK